MKRECVRNPYTFKKKRRGLKFHGRLALESFVWKVVPNVTKKLVMFEYEPLRYPHFD